MKKKLLVIIAILFLQSYSNAQNLISNGTFENGITGWTQVSGNWQAVPAFNYVFPLSGLYSAFPGQVAIGILTQTADLTSYSIGIDAGTHKLNFEGYLRTFAASNDDANIELEYLGSANNLLGTEPMSSVLGPSWAKISYFKTLPIGARYVKVKLIGTRITGNDCDAYFDDIYLSINDRGSGQALNLNGANQYGYAASNATFNIGYSYAMEGWFNFANDPTTSSSCLMEIGEGSDGRRWMWNKRTDLYSVGNYGIKCGFYNSVGQYNEFTFNYVPTQNKWTHLACSFDNSSKKMSFYVNGKLFDEQTNLGIGDPSNSNNVALYIGRQTYGFLPSFNGQIDQVRIWNSVLVGDGLRARMCRRLNEYEIQLPYLKAAYNFDETNNNNLKDEIVNSNAVLMNGATRVLSGAPIGDESVYEYNTVTNPLSLSNPYGSGLFEVQLSTAANTVDGIQLYYVTSKPNSKPGMVDPSVEDGYFGVFMANSNGATYNGAYSLTAQQVPNVSNLKLYKRNNNSVVTWQDANATYNPMFNTFNVTGQFTEYKIAPASILPLKFLTITGTLANKDAVINWELSNQEIPKKIELERSENGISFKQIGLIAVKDANDLQKYAYTDKEVFANAQTYFYRVKLTAENGKLTYSTVVKLSSKNTSTISIYPNPASDIITITGFKNKGTFTIVNSQGAEFIKNNITSNTTSIDISTLTPGLYFVNYFDGDKIISEKFVKQ